METGAAEFVWKVGKGVRWTQEKIDDKQHGSPVWLLIVPPHEAVEYRPLQKFTGLFRTFADTTPSREGILGFANKYGHLGSGITNREKIKQSETHERGGVLVSERFEAWVQEIVDMHRLVILWDLYKEANRKELARHIRWEKDSRGSPTVMYHSMDERAYPDEVGVTPACEEIASSASNPEWMDRLTQGDVLAPVLALIERAANKRLQPSTFSSIITRFDFDPSRRTLVLNVVPKNLRAALWLQFAMAVSENKTYRRCKVCSRWFEISPKTARSNRLFCSNTCRIKSYRGRQHQARQMYAAGETFKKIADELDSDVKTVKGWITGDKE